MRIEILSGRVLGQPGGRYNSWQSSGKYEKKNVILSEEEMNVFPYACREETNNQNK